MICENGHVRVEIMILILFFAFMLTDSVYTNFIIYRTCYVILGYNQSECALLGSQEKDEHTAKLEELVEPHAAIINMTRSITENCVTAILCLFIGPWSDRFGRKPLIIGPVMGFMFGFLGMVIFSLLPNTSPWYYLICSIPVCLTGGVPIFITGVLSHITDITTEANRGMRMGIFEAILGLGIFLGSLCSSYVFYATNYTTVFCIALGCCLVALILTWFFVPETLENKETQGYFKEFFKTSNFTDMLKSTFKNRENFSRAIILLNILLLTIYIFAINGDGSVIFLYLRDKFQWSLRQYTLFSSAGTTLYILGTVFGVYILHKLLNITESVLILTGFISMVNGHLIQGLATNNWHIYIASVVKCLGGVLSPMARSLVSKLIPHEEIGKVFAMIVTTESLFGILGSPLYTSIYNKTIEKDPSIFCFVTAGVYFLEVLITTVMIYFQYLRRNRLYQQLNNEENQLINASASEST